MEQLITILREIKDPRGFNARHDCASMLFVALMTTLCGATFNQNLDFSENAPVFTGTNALRAPGG